MSDIFKGITKIRFPLKNYCFVCLNILFCCVMFLFFVPGKVSLVQPRLVSYCLTQFLSINMDPVTQNFLYIKLLSGPSSVKCSIYDKSMTRFLLKTNKQKKYFYVCIEDTQHDSVLINIVLLKGVLKPLETNIFFYRHKKFSKN